MQNKKSTIQMEKKRGYIGRILTKSG